MGADASNFANWAIKSKKDNNRTKQSIGSVSSSPNSGSSGNWYSGSAPTLRETYARIREIGANDREAGAKAYNYLMQLQGDPSSQYYRPYSKATNQSVSNLNAMGFDTSILTDDWFNTNSGWIQSNLEYRSGTTNTPSSPNKKSTADQRLAFELYQYQKSEGQTKQAEKEYQDAIKEAQYWALRTDRNYSDDEIVAKVRKDFDKKYKTLSSMENSTIAPLELNRAVDFSDDVLYGAIWQARNDDYSNGMEYAMVNSYLGTGKTWQENQKIANQLNPESPEYLPYATGSTNLDNAAMHFGVKYFDSDWAKNHKYILNSGSDEDIKYFRQVQQAEENTRAAEKAVDALGLWMEKNIYNATDPDKAKAAFDKIYKKGKITIRTENGREEVDLSILKKMDQSIGMNGEPGTTDLVSMTRGINYKYDNIMGTIDQICELNNQNPVSDGSKLIDYTQNNWFGNSTSNVSSVIRKAQDDRLNGYADVYLKGGTEAEQDYVETSWSSTYDDVKANTEEVADWSADKENAIKMIQSEALGAQKDYAKATMGNFQTVYDYETQKSNLQYLKSELEKIAPKIDGKAPVDATGKHTDKVLVDGEEYTITTAYSKDIGYYLESAVNSSGDDVGHYVFIEPEIDALVNKYNSEAQNTDNVNQQMLANMTDEERANYDKYRSIQLGIEDCERYLAEHQKEYEDSSKALTEAQKKFNEQYYLMQQYGISTADLDVENAVFSYLVNFNDYEATSWSAYNPSDAYRIAIAEGKDKNEIYAAAEEGNKQILAELEDAKAVKQYLTELGADIPQNYIQNLDRHIAKLERDVQDYEYFSLSKEKDFKELAQKGRQEEFDNRPLWWKPVKVDPEYGWGYDEYFQHMSDDPDMYSLFAGYGLRGKAGPLVKSMSEDEKDTYYYLMAKGEEAKANDYIKSLTDSSYGVLQSRYTQEYQEELDNKFKEGGLGASIGQNILAVLAAPASAMMSLGYGVYTALSGKELNPDNIMLAFNNFRTSTREDTAKQISNYFGEGTFGQKAAQFFYEMVSNRLDSLANGLTLGMGGEGFFGQIGGASGMGISAAMDAMMEAKRRGASDGQAWGIGAATFFAETVTEAIDLKDVAEAKRLGFSKAGMKEFAKNWLTKAGVNEAIGESINDIVENIADRIAMGDNSEHANKVYEYRMQGYSVDEAEALAYRDEIGGVMRTAVMSYLSPGMDIVSYGAGRASRYFNEIQTRRNQNPNERISETIKRVNEENAKAKEEQQKAKEKAAEEEAKNQEYLSQDTANGEGALNLDLIGYTSPEGQAELEKLRQMEAERSAKEKTNDRENSMADWEILETARKSDTPTQTASIAAILNDSRTETSSDEAKSAATNLGKALKGRNVINWLQTIFTGASVGGVNTAEVKQGIRYAAIGGEQSSSYQLIQSEEFQNAAPDRQAQMLAVAGYNDARNEAVQKVLNKNVYENRVAEAQKTLETTDPEFQREMDSADEIERTADEQRATVLELELQQEEKQEAAKAAADHYTAATMEYLADPSDANKHAMDTARDQYGSADQRAMDENNLKKARARLEELEAAAKQTREEALTKVRQAAVDLVNQVDNARTEAENKRQADEKAAQEAYETQKTITQEVLNKAKELKNFTHLNAEDFVDQNFPNISEEDRRHAIGLTIAAQKAMSRNFDSANARREFSKNFTKRFNLNYEEVSGDTINGANARIDPSTRTLLINKNATQWDIMYAVLTHEITHLAEEASNGTNLENESSAYTELADMALQIRYGDGVTWKDAIAKIKAGDQSSKIVQDYLRIKKIYDESTATKSNDHSIVQIMQEIVADSVGYVISGDEAALQRLAQKPNLARRVIEAIKSFIRKAQGMEGEPLTQAQQVVDKLTAILNENQNKSGQNTKYQLTPYSTEELMNWRRSDKIIVYDGDPSTLDRFINNSLDYPDQFKKMYFGKIDPALALRIKNETGIETEGLNLTLRSNEVVKVMDHSHGNYVAETNRGQTPVTANEIEEAIQTIEEPDTIKKDVYLENGKPHDAITFTKDINGRVNAFTYVISTKHDLAIQTIYKNIKNGSSASEGDAQTSPQTSMTSRGTASKNSLPQTDVNVNTIVSDDEGNALATELPGGTVTLDEENYRHSLSTFDFDEKMRVRQALLDKKDEYGNQQFTAEEVDNYLADALSLAAMISYDRQRLDFEANPVQSFLKKNQDYYYTLDASTLCAKRLLYQGTFNEVQHMIPNEALMPDDLIDLVNIMREMGYETPCGICYVESRRRWLDKYAQEWLDSFEGENKPNLDQLTTSDGLEELRLTDPDTYQAFVDAMNAKGSANPKVVQLRTEYNGDIAKLSASDIQKVKDIGGLRIQSFSDFETPHLLDMVQAVYDMASVGLTSQAYTKVPNFAWVFGDTGIKINLSLIGKGTGLDENGNLVFDNVEGMNFEEAMKLRNKYSKNVGTILVGMNDEHIIAAMGDSRIDFIIPFHRSGWSQGELSRIGVLNNYTDYTSGQNERVILERVSKVLKEWKSKDKGKAAVEKWIAENGEDYEGYRVEETEKGYRIVFDGYKTESFAKHKERTGEDLSNFEPVGAHKYWDFTKSGQWNAENYLKMCAESKRMPKFSQFLVDNGDGSFSLPQGDDKRSTAIREGYWKTLIDFKMYDNDGNGSPQTEVSPNVNMAEAYRVMNEYKLGRQMPDRADGTKGPFIPMENNNDLPKATPAAQAFTEYIKIKRQEQQKRTEQRLADQKAKEAAGIVVKPESKEARDKRIAQEGREIYNTYAANTFGTYMGDATLGNTNNEYVEPSAQQSQMAVDAETGETVQYRNSLPSDTELDSWFDQYIENMSADELDQLAQEMFGISLNTTPQAEPASEQAEAAPVEQVNEPELAANFREAYKAAVESGDLNTARNIIDQLAKRAGYTVRGTHRTNANFTVFDRSKQSGERGKTLGDGFYVAKGEHTEYDDDSYGKNRMLVYIKPGNVFDIQKGGLSEEQAREVYAKYFAPLHPDASDAYDDENPYTYHVVQQLQKSYKVMDYIKEAAKNAGVTTDVVFKDLGYNSIKDGPQYCVFDNTQIKSADPMTYNDQGEMIEPDNRFDKTNPDIRYSLPSDAPYLSAVDHGDMEEAQRLVDQKAEETGYNYKAFHGTTRQFNTFRFTPDDLGIHLGTKCQARMMAGRGKDARVIEAYVKLENPIRFERDLGAWEGKRVAKELYDMGIITEQEAADALLSSDRTYRLSDEKATKNIRDLLISKGYDGFVYDNDFEGYSKKSQQSIAVFDPSQIKVADPVTYDSQGNVIPLSERFQTEKQDIRYSLPSDDVLQQQILDYLNNNNTAVNNEAFSGPMEGQNPGMSSDQGPAQRQYGQRLQSIDEIDQAVREYISKKNAYFPDTNAEQIDRAIKWIRSNKRSADSDGYAESFQAVTSKNFNYLSADGQARMLAVMGMAVAKGDAIGQATLNDAFNRQGTDIARALQARKLYRLMTPEGRVQSLENMMGRVQESLDLKGIKADLKFSHWIYDLASVAESEADFRQLQRIAANEIAQQIPANWKDKLRSLRMLSMLGNPRTHVRNFVGNAVFVPIVGVKNKIGALLELKKPQGQKTKTLSLRLDDAIRQFARADAEKMKDVLTGEAKYNENNLVNQEMKAFKGLLQAVIDFNSNKLEQEDWFFLKRHYTRSFGGWMQANGYTEQQLKSNPSLLEQGRAYATLEAQKATYRDFNEFAKRLNDFVRNPKTLEGKAGALLVEAVLPFKKTPANILRRGLEYSPVGLIKSLTYDLHAMHKYNEAIQAGLTTIPEDAITPNQWIDKVASGLTGTGIMLAGMLLSSMGLITCSLGDDDDPEKENGNQKYSLKLLGTDLTYTIDWAAPACIPLFVGAAIMEEHEDMSWSDLANAVTGITEPVFNLSMLDGLSSVFKTSSYGDKTDPLTQVGLKIGTNYISSYWPSAFGAISRTFFDDTRRKSYVPSDKSQGPAGTVAYAWESLKNKTPLSRTSIPVRDIWGEEERSGFIERLIENFASPGYFNKTKDDPILNEMSRLYDTHVEGSSDLVPSNPKKSYTYKNQKYVFSDKEWDEMYVARAQTAHNLLNNLIRSKDYNDADDATKVQMMKSVWSYAEKVGLSKVIPDYDYDQVSVESIAEDGKKGSYKTHMLTALDTMDYDGYDAMIEALHELGVEDSSIKSWISNKYRDQYKTAYRKGNDAEMARIEDILFNSGLDFDIDAWEEQVDKKYGD